MERLSTTSNAYRSGRKASGQRFSDLVDFGQDTGLRHTLVSLRNGAMSVKGAACDPLLHEGESAGSRVAAGTLHKRGMEDNRHAETSGKGAVRIQDCFPEASEQCPTLFASNRLIGRASFRDVECLFRGVECLRNALLAIGKSSDGARRQRALLARRNSDVRVRWRGGEIGQ